MSKPLTQSDLIFPSASISLSNTLSSIKRTTLSIHNRLSSIFLDSTFVARISEAYNLPLVANERCGGWYIPPEKKAESCYFKSTDGHMNQWGFNLRRLNLQVLDVIGGYGGYVLNEIVLCRKKRSGWWGTQVRDCRFNKEGEEWVALHVGFSRHAN